MDSNPVSGKNTRGRRQRRGFQPRSWQSYKGAWIPTPLVAKPQGDVGNGVDSNLEGAVSLLRLCLGQVLQEGHLLQLPRRRPAAAAPDRGGFVRADHPPAQLRVLLRLLLLLLPLLPLLPIALASPFDRMCGRVFLLQAEVISQSTAATDDDRAVAVVVIGGGAARGEEAESFLLLELPLTLRAGAPDGLLEVLRLQFSRLQSINTHANTQAYMRTKPGGG